MQTAAILCRASCSKGMGSHVDYRTSQSAVAARCCRTTLLPVRAHSATLCIYLCPLLTANIPRFTCLSSAAKRGLTLEDVRQLVERHHSIELPGFSPYSAVQELVSRHQTGWAAAAADCVAAAHRQLLQLVLLHVARTFSRFPAAAEHIR
jgi:hypothetical protein